MLPSLIRAFYGTPAPLRELFAIVNDIYGPNSQAAFSFGKTVESLDRLCTEMRQQAIQDCPGLGAERLYE